MWTSLNEPKSFHWKRSTLNYLKNYIPSIITWLPQYRVSNLVGDILAGLTVGIMVIPQALSYSVLAGLDPIYGLYTAFLPCVIYALLGSSRHLIIGPTTVLSLMVSTWIKSPNSHGIKDAFILSFLSGIFMTILGFLKAGFLTSVISAPISIGFTAGAGLLIGLTQVKYVFGLKTLASFSTIIEFIKSIQGYSGTVNWWTFLFASVSLVYIMGLKNFKYTKMVPGPLFAIAIGSLLAYGFNLNQRIGLDIVKDIPKGLPKPAIPISSGSDFVRVAPYALVMAIVSIVEGVSISKPISSKFGYPLSGDQELVSIGIANFIGSFFLGYPNSGSFTRTAVNISTGGKTPISGFIGSILVMCTLLFLTPLLYYLPYAVLGSIVLSGVTNLFEIHAMIHTFKVSKRDFFTIVATFILTILLGIEWGIIISVLVNVVVLLVSAFSESPKKFLYRSNYEGSEIYLIEAQGSLIYLNIDSFSNDIDDIVNRIKENESSLENYCIVDFSKVMIVDTTSLKKFKDIGDQCSRCGLNIYFVQVKEEIRKRMITSGLIQKDSPIEVMGSRDEAVEFIKSKRSNLIINNDL